MTSGEKGIFCESMAGLFSPPDGENFRHLFSSFPQIWTCGNGDPTVPSGFESELNTEVLSDIQKDYERLFLGRGECVSLVESAYKPWTLDPECRLSFAREKGLLMGDSALHMAAIFQCAGVEVPEQFVACPDHLVLELEFLAALYREVGDREVEQFIGDHLDWIPELKKEIMKLHPHAFYRSAVETLDLFLHRERERLEKEGYGSKSVS